MIGEIGALGGGILPNVLGMSKQHTGSYRLEWICYAALAFAILIMMRVVARSWTKTWVASAVALMWRPNLRPSLPTTQIRL